MIHTGEKCQKLYDRFGDLVELREYIKLGTWIFGRKWFSKHVRWIWLDDKEDYWMVWLPNGKHSHSRIFGARMIAAEIRKSDGEMNYKSSIIPSLTTYGAWETIIYPHMVEEDRAKEIFEIITNRIDRAYKYWFE